MLTEDECREIYVRGIKLRKEHLRVTDDDILRAVHEAGRTPAEIGESAVTLLRNHPERLKGASIEALVLLVRICKRPADYAALLASLLVCTNHQWNENLAEALQREKDPTTVDALYDAALTIHDHLHYDEFFNVARKCTWALADIGTPEAHAKLQLLAKNENPMIAQYAQKRLDGWEREMSRKGTVQKS
jgi:hypothetical protein